MIQGIWGKVHIYCGCHGDNTHIKLTPHEGSASAVWGGGNNSMFYSCPKYYSDKREENESICFNRLNLVEYEDMVKHISDELENDDDFMETINLTNYSWTNKKGTEFKVVRHNEDRIDVLVVNRHALKN